MAEDKREAGTRVEITREQFYEQSGIESDPRCVGMCFYEGNILIAEYIFVGDPPECDWITKRQVEELNRMLEGGINE